MRARNTYHRVRCYCRSRKCCSKCALAYSCSQYPRWRRCHPHRRLLGRCTRIRSLRSYRGHRCTHSSLHHHTLRWKHSQTDDGGVETFYPRRATETRTQRMHKTVGMPRLVACCLADFSGNASESRGGWAFRRSIPCSIFIITLLDYEALRLSCVL